MRMRTARCGSARSKGLRTIRDGALRFARAGGTGVARVRAADPRGRERLALVLDESRPLCRRSRRTRGARDRWRPGSRRSAPIAWPMACAATSSTAATRTRACALPTARCGFRASVGSCASIPTRIRTNRAAPARAHRTRHRGWSQPLDLSEARARSAGRHELGIPVHGAQHARARARALSLPAGGLSERMDRRRRATHRLLHRPAAGRVRVPRDREQRRRRVERRGRRRCASLSSRTTTRRRGSRRCAPA